MTWVTALPAAVGPFGGTSLVCAAWLDVVFCLLGWGLWRQGGAARGDVLFHYSLLYLALLFVAVAVDAALS